MRPPTSGGGFLAIWYTLKKARAAGGFLRTWRALRSKNACKTCALGMGGQSGGMVNEAGHFPEVCKKSMQAMAADMAGKLKDGFFEEFTFAHLARFSPRELEASGRITQPLFAGPGDKSYRAVSWDEALERIAIKMRATQPDHTFFYASGRSSNEAGFLLQLFARLYGTNNVNNCSYFCHQASGVGLKQSLGSGTGTVVLEDLAHTDLLFIIGANPASNHPRLMRNLIDLKRRGGKVVVINPLREIGLVNFRVPSDPRSLFFGSPIADEYLQPHIGGDIALLSGVAKAILESHDTAIARKFIADHTEGFDAWLSSIQAMTWPDITTRSGVEEPTLRRIAALYAASKNTIFCWTMGITHHTHGVANVHAISNLALLRGMAGRQGAGLLPLRGHSNVQGMGTVGVSPVPSAALLTGLEGRYNVTLPKTPGMDTLASVRAAADGNIRFVLHLGGNLFGSCPDAAFAERALRGIDLTVFLSTTLNTGHIKGRGKDSIILPVRARDEEAQPTTQESMFSFVRYSDGGKQRYEGPRGEVEVIADLAHRVLGDSLPLGLSNCDNHQALRQSIAAVIPELEQLGTIDQTKKEFHIPGRVIREPKFPTKSGRAAFILAPLPPARADDRIRLMTIRSEGQFNTVVYEDEDIYRGQDRRDVILLNPADMQRLGLKENDRVTITSDTGRMESILARPFDIRAGNAAMYYPEANALVPAAADPLSRTPAFKNIPITIRKSTALPVVA